MILLEGKDIWANLRTGFIDIDELLLFLKMQQFNGYFSFEFSDIRAAIFLQEGDVVNGIEYLEEERKVGPATVNTVLLRARQDKKGNLNVTQLPRPNASRLSEIYCFSVFLLHKNISSAHYNLGQFFERLKYEAFSGYLEMLFQSEQKRAVLSWDRGQIQAFLSQELLVDLKEQQPSQIRFISSMIESAQRSGVYVDAYVKY